MTINNIMGKPLKHYATDKNTNARYVVLALENDTDKDTCSVVDIDTLDPDMRSELTAIIDSDECQRVIDTWKVLDRKFFMSYPKQTVLAVLRAMRKIKVLDSEQVLVQLPNDVVQTPKEIANAIREYNMSRKAPTMPQPMDDFGGHGEVAEKVMEAENKNAEDIKELKEQVSNISSSIAELLTLMKSQGSKSKK